MRRRFTSVLAIVLAIGVLGLQPVAAVERAQPCTKEGATASTPAKRALVCVRRLDGPLLWQFVAAPSKTSTIITYGTIPAAKLVRIRRGIAAAEAYLGTDAGAITYHVYDKATDAVLMAYLGQNYHPGEGLEPTRRFLESGTAIGSLGKVFVRGAITDYPTIGKSLETVIIHEYEHTRQAAFYGSPKDVPPDQVPFFGPRWLIEGAAELAGYRGADAYGYTSWSLAASASITGPYGALREAKTPLSRMRTQDEQFGLDTNGFYGSSFAAAVLLSFYTSDKAVLTTYWQKIGAGLPWEEAFTAAFGMTSTDFYAKHLKWQQAKFALSKIPPRH